MYIVNAQDVNLLINIGVIIVNIGASLFPLFWLKSNNGDYRDGFKLIMPSLALCSVVSFLFMVLYLLRVFQVITNSELMSMARLVVSGFLFLPLTMVISLHNWKK